MCGRYALFGPSSRHGDYFQTGRWPEFSDRFNIAPSTWVPVIRQAPDGGRVADLLRWGLVPHWAKDESIGAKLNNARGETVAEKPSFRSAYQRRRCIVSAMGFYEWQAVPAERKQPWFIHLKSGQPMALGGIWESWTSPNGDIIRSFCIVTVGPNEIMAPIHDRMPVILKPEDWLAWLSPATEMMRVSPLVKPAPSGTMEAWPVSRRLNSAREDTEDLIARLAD
jgi:putative SOS response-associated peptidase YedK